MTQPELVLNFSVPEVDRKRLRGQCLTLLERLQRGPMTNVDAVVELRVLNATARISELRQAGYNVVAKRESGGVWSYRLQK